tara:strand:+ start:7544 stop:7735 length:192 start_codon:yes stop_codon:yes gene_type:complete
MIKNLIERFLYFIDYKAIDTQQPSKPYEKRIIKQIDSDLKDILQTTEELKSDIRIIKDYLSKK